MEPSRAVPSIFRSLALMPFHNHVAVELVGSRLGVGL